MFAIINAKVQADIYGNKYYYEQKEFESPIAHQMALLLKCRGPGFHPNINPPSFGIYIITRGKLWLSVFEVSRHQKKRYENSFYMVFTCIYAE